MPIGRVGRRLRFRPGDGGDERLGRHPVRRVTAGAQQNGAGGRVCDFARARGGAGGTHVGVAVAERVGVHEAAGAVGLALQRHELQREHQVGRQVRNDGCGDDWSARLDGRRQRRTKGGVGDDRCRRGRECRGRRRGAVHHVAHRDGQRRETDTVTHLGHDVEARARHARPGRVGAATGQRDVYARVGLDGRDLLHRRLRRQRLHAAACLRVGDEGNRCARGRYRRGDREAARRRRGSGRLLLVFGRLVRGGCR